MPDSASGEAEERSSPNSAQTPSGARHTPPSRPTSSPWTTTSGSARSAAGLAGGGSGVPRAGAPAPQGRWRLCVDGGEEVVGRLARRWGQPFAHRFGQLLAAVAELARLRVVEHAFTAQQRLQPGERVAAAPA